MRLLTHAIVCLSAVGAVCLSLRADANRYGGLHFKSPVEVDGVAYPAGTTLHAEVYPTQMVVRPIVPEGKAFQWFSCSLPRATYLNSRSGENSFYQGLNARFPTVRLAGMDGSFLMTPPGDSAVVLTNEAVYAAKVVYVATNGTDEASAGSEAQPFETIQYAIDFLHENYRYLNTIVLVKPGVYAKGGFDGDANNFRSRVRIHGDQHVLVKSTDGADATVIEGELDPSTESGLGENARRCVTFQINAGGDACIQGFTFRKGRTRDSTGGQLYTNQGGGIGAQRSNYAISQHIAADCVFADCLAGYASGAAWNMWLFRCHVIGGGARATSSSYLVSSLVDGEDAGGMGSFSFQSSGRDFGVTALNSVGGSCRLSPGGSYWGTVCTQNGKDGNPLGHTWASDYVVDSAAGDWRPVREGSADCGAQVPEAGTEAWYLWTDVMAALACGDLNGDKVVWRNGVPLSGAVMSPVSVCSVTVSKPKEVGIAIPNAVVGESQTSLRVVEGGRLTIERTETGSRYASAVVCGGVTNRFDDLPDGRFVYDVAPGEKALDLEILMSRDWYVGALGSAADANSGFTPASPKGTLAGAMAVATAGDTVRALPGTYSEGVMRNSVHPDHYMRSRVVVGDGVTLESVAGPETTIIVGAKATSEAGPVDEYGCGSNAVRCAYVRATGLLRGFTLTGGRVNHIGNGDDDVSSGGGVQGDYVANSPLSTIEDCIVSNNAAHTGGAGHCVRFVRCRIFDNYAVKREALGWYNAFIDTVAASNHSANGWAAFRYADVVNSTFGPEFDLGGALIGTSLYESFRARPFVNSIVAHAVNHSFSACQTATNCLFASSCNHEQVNCRQLDWAAMKLDGRFVPRMDSPAVDAGWADASRELTVDAFRGQRVYNGAIDIGAVEYDWRRVYAKSIARRDVNVTAADPRVVLRDRKVTLDPGASFVCEWVAATPSATCEIVARVTGSGLLTVTADDLVVGTVTEETSPATLTVGKRTADGTRLVFRHAASEGNPGVAIVDKVHTACGLMLICR